MITSLKQLPEIRAEKNNLRIVLALGAFDVIHPGHIKYLKWAKEQGDVLVVTLKSDRQISLHKGPDRPVVKEQDRVEVVESLKPVDYALIGAPGGLHEAATVTAQALQPDVVVLGPDWGHEVFNDWKIAFPNALIMIAPHQSDCSTTKIINKIKR